MDDARLLGAQREISDATRAGIRDAERRHRRRLATVWVLLATALALLAVIARGSL